MQQLFLLEAEPDCQPLTANTWQNIALFSLALFGLLLLVTAGMWLWSRRVGEARDTAQRVARNSVVPLGLQMITRGLDFVFVIVVLYPLLCKSAIGRFEFSAVLVVMYIGTIADFGLSIITTRDVALDPASAPVYFRTMVRLRTWLGLAVIPLAFALPLLLRLLNSAGLTSEAITDDYFILIGILVLTLVPTGYASAATALFNATERMEIPGVLNVITNIASTLLRITALWLGYGLIGMTVGSLLATLLSVPLFAVALRRTFGELPLRGPLMPWRPLVREGWPLMLNSLLLFVFFRFDSFIITPTQGAKALASYNAAYKYINLTQILPPIVVNALFPLLSRRAVEDQAAFRHAYHYTLRLLVLLALPIATATSLLAEPLMDFLADERFVADGAPALAILIWYLPLAYINGLTQYVLIALGRPKVITAAFGITAVFNLAANLALVPIWGINAAAAITVASELVLYLVYHRTLRGTVGAPPLLALSWRPALASLVVAAAMIALRAQGAILAALVAVAIYLIALAALRTLTHEDRRIVRRILGRTSS